MTDPKTGGSRGKTPGSGRQKGTPNKLTASVRAAIERAFEEVGGSDYLVEVARNDPKTFCTLLAKLMPSQLQHSGAEGGPVAVRQVPDLEVARRIAFVLHRAQLESRRAQEASGEHQTGGQFAGRALHSEAIEDEDATD